MFADAIGGLGWLFILVLVGAAVWLSRQENNRSRQMMDERARDKVRDARWLEYIASFKTAAQTDRERRMVDTMLAGGTVDDLRDEPAASVAKTSAVVAAGTSDQSQMLEPVQPAPQVRQPIDGTSLLLYFGAFLFVASVGLFVAFGNFSGAIRTLLVLLTAAVMYGGGLWLYGRDRRLKPAGISFVAIGLAIAPLVGVAAYTYASGGLSGPAVWLLTSLLCAGLYAHAMLRLRVTLLPYLFIASFVSLFESGIAVLEVPAPYFVWGLITAGLLLKLLHVLKLVILLHEPADRSASLLVPVSLFGALAMIPDHGYAQLAVSSVLAASYYTLNSYADQWRQSASVVAAQALYIMAVLCGTYAYSGSRSVTVIAGLVLVGLHIAALCIMPATNRVVRDAATVVFGLSLVMVPLAWHDGVLLAVTVAVTAVTGLSIAALQYRLDAYIGGSLALIAAPFVVGQLALTQQLGQGAQSALAFAAAALLVLSARLVVMARTGLDSWRDTALVLPVLAAVVAALPAWLAGGWLVLLGGIGLSATIFGLAALARQTDFWVVGAAALVVPVLLLLGEVDAAPFLVAVMVGLAGNAAVALYKHQEVNRWLLTGLSLLVPLALGNGAVDVVWQPHHFGYAYLVVVAILLACRVLSMMSPRTDSLSYRAGYVAAAVIAVLVSLASDASQLHTTVILTLLLVLSIVLSWYVEARRVILALVPWLAQLTLMSLIRPNFEASAANLLVLLSLAVAALCFGLADDWRERIGQPASRLVRISCLAAVYLPLWTCLFYQEDAIVPPFVLAVAGSLSLYAVWRRSQASREVAVAVIVAAVIWMLDVAGIDNLQVQTHLAAAMLAGFAYWRHIRDESIQCDGYLKAMFAVATVPLVLQALGGVSGDVYGWLLIVQQVGFMILGISINKRYLTWWGLYVSVAAVLYQLRDLGWAALTVLALFVIGVAVYRLLKRGSSDPPA